MQVVGDAVLLAVQLPALGGRDLIRVSTADGVLDTLRGVLLSLAEKQSAPVKLP